MFWEKKIICERKILHPPDSLSKGPSLNYIKSFDGKKIEDKQSFIFVDKGKFSFSYEIDPRGIQFFSSQRSDFFWRSTKAAKSLKTFISSYTFYSMVKNLLLFKENVCIFIIFFGISAWGKLRHSPRFEMRFVLNIYPYARPILVIRVA